MLEILREPFVTRIPHLWASAYTDAIARSAILLVGACLVTIALRKRAAATRHLVWTLAFFAVVLLPLLSAALPAWRALPRWADAGTSVLAPLAVEVTLDAEALPAETGVTFEGLPPREFALTDNAPVTMVAVGQEASREPSRITAQTALMLLWVFGVLATLAPVLAGFFALARLSRRARIVASGPWAETLKVAMAQMHLAKPVTLLDGGEGSMPAVWGVFRTRLLVPAEGLSWTSERRLVVLLHELAHVKRFDCLTRMVARVACSAYWFNPLAWFAWRRLQAESERACDDLVITRGTSAADYAGHILAVVSGVQHSVLTNQAAIAMARRSGLEGRLVSILDETASRRGLTRAALALAIILAAAVVTPIAITKAATEPAAPAATGQGAEAKSVATPAEGEKTSPSEAATKATKVTPEELTKAVENGTLKRLVTTAEEFQKLYGKPLRENREQKGGGMEVLFLVYDGFVAAFQRFHANEPFGLFAFEFGQKGWRDLGEKGLSEPAKRPQQAKPAGEKPDEVKTSTATAVAVKKAIADGTLKYLVTTSDEFKKLFGKPTDEKTESEGGTVQTLFLAYDGVVAAFAGDSSKSEPFKLYGFNFGDGWRALGDKSLEETEERGVASFMKVRPIDSVKEFDDVRFKDMGKLDLSQQKGLPETLEFNEAAVWPPSEKLPPGCDPKVILENAKNPGLGVRELHKDGITGKGVTVAIIDQPLYEDHPEFAGKIAAYYDAGCEGSESSMHGPSVASLLVGTNCGTAPDARLYYVAAPSWTADAAFLAKALDWVVEQNANLPDGQKIRAVSISATPSGPGSPFTKNNNNKMWDDACERAGKAGILIVDCEMTRGFVGPCFYDATAPEDVAKCTAGFPTSPGGSLTGMVLAPTSVRTTAEEYVKGQCSYAYWGQGGLSWGIPYATGVMAMGWQVRPDLDGGWMKYLLYDSAYVTRDGARIINPKEFIKRVKEAKVEPGQAPPAIPQRETGRGDGMSDLTKVRPVSSVKMGDDVRWKDMSSLDLSGEKGLAEKLWFNEKTVWPPAEKMPGGFDAKALLEKGKRPPLGVTDLHKDGITGKGVAIAILSQPVLPDHPEFAGKIAEYEDVGCAPASETSMVGPTVLSLAVGTSCGTAPEAKVYFVAVPVWKRDATFSAKALDWVVERNKTLVGADRIRLVADAQPPTGAEWANKDAWDEARKRAEAAGILVVTDSHADGFVAGCGYDLDDSGNLSKCVVDMAGAAPETAAKVILAPAPHRTSAEEYTKGEYGYHFMGPGGPAGVPYTAGVLALAWQVRPDLSGDQMKELLFKSAYVTKDGWKVINPKEFIRLVREAKAAEPARE